MSNYHEPAIPVSRLKQTLNDGWRSGDFDSLHRDGWNAALLWLEKKLELSVPVQKMDDALLDTLEDLLEAIPRQTNDQDWWPDELTKAVKAAKAVIAKARPE